MTRRLFGPVGGPIVFFLVAALVFGGLAWVTYSSLQVEQAQREAAARAELGSNLRVALRQLDIRMLPVLSVEDSRPYYHYAPPDPAATPLLAAILPDWIKLHFQLDPNEGWSSPLVLDRETAERVRAAWADVSPRNLSDDRAACLRDLKFRCPASGTLDVFAATDRSIPPDSLSLAAPLVAGDVQQEQSSNPTPLPPSESSPKPAPPVNQDPISNSITPVSRPDANADSIRFLGWELCLRNNDGLALNNAQQLVQNSLKAGNDVGQQGGNPRGTLQAPSGGMRGGAGRLGQKDVDNEKVADWLNRAASMTRATKEAKNAAEFQMPKGQMGNYGGQNFQPNGDPRNTANTINPTTGNKTEGGPPTLPTTGGAPPGPGGVGPVANPPGPGGSFGNPNDDRSKDAKGPPARDYDGKTGRGPGSEQDKYGTTYYKDSEALKKLIARESLLLTYELSTWFTRPNETRLRMALDEVGKGGRFQEQPVDREKASSVTVPGGPPAPPTGEDRPPQPVAPIPVVGQPTAIHLGSMRPQWLTAPDGTDMLVLVRAAKIDNKTVYQGIVVDWAKLESALKEEVKDLFPEAKLVPVKDSSAVYPDRAMTALPVQLDPGPEPELAPAGWTTLRMGLVLAWVAAIIAFAAVGFAGWSLIDLAERRIRFVSAVTHELRTPLTSLRLYLDLLVSGMIQDESKRQEYLGTLAMESDRLHRLIDNVLDFAKLEKRKKNGDVKPVRVNELVEQLQRTWTDRVAQDGKELVVISTIPSEREVSTDSAMIHQIVGNLIDNARKYTRDAADKRIWLWAKPGVGNAVMLEVEDRGAGVPAGERKSIFKPFRRGEQADSRAGGAGLGLALAKSWAEVLGAKLTYRPADGGTGACFRLELPGV